MANSPLFTCIALVASFIYVSLGITSDESKLTILNIDLSQVSLGTDDATAPRHAKQDDRNLNYLSCRTVINSFDKKEIRCGDVADDNEELSDTEKPRDLPYWAFDVMATASKSGKNTTHYEFQFKPDTVAKPQATRNKVPTKNPLVTGLHDLLEKSGTHLKTYDLSEKYPKEIKPIQLQFDKKTKTTTKHTKQNERRNARNITNTGRTDNTMKDASQTQTDAAITSDVTDNALDSAASTLDKIKKARIELTKTLSILRMLQQNSGQDGVTDSHQPTNRDDVTNDNNGSIDNSNDDIKYDTEHGASYVAYDDQTFSDVSAEDDSFLTALEKEIELYEQGELEKTASTTNTSRYENDEYANYIAKYRELLLSWFSNNKSNPQPDVKQRNNNNNEAQPSYTPYTNNHGIEIYPPPGSSAPQRHPPAVDAANGYYDERMYNITPYQQQPQSILSALKEMGSYVGPAAGVASSAGGQQQLLHPSTYIEHEINTLLRENQEKLRDFRRHQYQMQYYLNLLKQQEAKLRKLQQDQRWAKTVHASSLRQHYSNAHQRQAPAVVGTQAAHNAVNQPIAMMTDGTGKEWNIQAMTSRRNYRPAVEVQSGTFVNPQLIQPAPTTQRANQMPVHLPALTNRIAGSNPMHHNVPFANIDDRVFDPVLFMEQHLSKTLYNSNAPPPPPPLPTNHVVKPVISDPYGIAETRAAVEAVPAGEGRYRFLSYLESYQKQQREQEQERQQQQPLRWQSAASTSKQPSQMTQPRTPAAATNGGFAWKMPSYHFNRHRNDKMASASADNVVWEASNDVSATRSYDAGRLMTPAPPAHRGARNTAALLRGASNTHSAGQSQLQSAGHKQVPPILIDAAARVRVPYAQRHAMRTRHRRKQTLIPQWVRNRT